MLVLKHAYTKISERKMKFNNNLNKFKFFIYMGTNILRFLRAIKHQEIFFFHVVVQNVEKPYKYVKKKTFVYK